MAVENWESWRFTVIHIECGCWCVVGISWRAPELIDAGPCVVHWCRRQRGDTAGQINVTIVEWNGGWRATGDGDLIALSQEAQSYSARTRTSTCTYAHPPITQT